MMVDRRWPTCISLAMLGEEKSTSTFLRGSNGGLAPAWVMEAMLLVMVAVDSLMLMNPFGYATERERCHVNVQVKTVLTSRHTTHCGGGLADDGVLGQRVADAVGDVFGGHGASVALDRL